MTVIASDEVKTEDEIRAEADVKQKAEAKRVAAVKAKTLKVYSFSYTIGRDVSSTSATVAGVSEGAARALLEKHIRASVGPKERFNVSHGSLVVEPLITEATPLPAATAQPTPTPAPAPPPTPPTPIK
jgi:hypothetical protein